MFLLNSPSIAFIFLTFTICIYLLVFFYGYWEYECYDEYGIDGEYDVSDALAVSCMECHRYMFTPFVSTNFSSISSWLFPWHFYTLLLLWLFMFIGFYYMIKMDWMKNFSVPCAVAIVCLMSSLWTYINLLDMKDTGSVSLAIAALFHVFTEYWFFCWTVCLFIGFLSGREVSYVIVHLVTVVSFFSFLFYFLFGRLFQFSLFNFMLGRFTGHFHVFGHLWLNFMWFLSFFSSYNYFRNLGDFGPALNILIVNCFGVHTFGTSLHPLVDSKLSLTGEHDCFDVKDDIFFLHGGLALFEGWLMFFFWCSVDNWLDRVSNYAKRFTKFFGSNGLSRLTIFGFR